MPILILVRHAESEKNVLRIVNHDFTIPYHLTKRGRGQAQQASIALNGTAFTHAFVSRYARAQETASIILAGHNVPCDIDPRLDEIHNGTLEGETITTYHERIHDRVKETPQGGETWEALKERLSAFLDEMRERTGTILIVSHGHPVAVMRGIIEGWDDHHMETAIPTYSEYFRYEFPDG